MRLNRVKLFYALVATIDSESRRCLRGRGDHMHTVCIQKWLATARSPAGEAGHGLATYKGRPGPGPLQGATTHGHGRQRPVLPPAGAALVAGEAAGRKGQPSPV
ncbi:hypothetical protein GW17_00049539 [Ensete ventricosum]|nr:hypothetical protein GW17_00049539 [Ensete ventricosum]